MILLAIPVVQWVVYRNAGPVVAASVDRGPEIEPYASDEFLAQEISPSAWARSASETADEITRLGQAGRIREAMELANYALALPRHPVTNNPFGQGHATLALERMLQIFEAYELWDEAITFCNAPDAIAIGNALVESKRLRLLGAAFASKGQLTFRSRIYTVALNELREELDQRQDEEQHHNEICVPQDVIEIDYVGNEAAREHIAHSVNCIAAYLDGMRGDHAAAIRKAAATDMSPLQTARILSASGDHSAASALLSEFAVTSSFPAATLTALAEVQARAGHQVALLATLKKLNALLLKFALDSTLRRRLEPIVQKTSVARTWHSAPETLVASNATQALQAAFPLALRAPTFRLPGVNDQVYSLDDYRGKPVLVVFYLGRGCLHCARQLKHLAPVAFDFEDAGISIIGISTDRISTLTKSFASYRGRIPYPLAADSELRAFASYRLHEGSMDEPLHGTFLLNAEGEVIWRDSGDEPFMDMDFLLAECKRLLQRSGP